MSHVCEEENICEVPETGEVRLYIEGWGCGLARNRVAGRSIDIRLEFCGIGHVF